MSIGCFNEISSYHAKSGIRFWGNQYSYANTIITIDIKPDCVVLSSSFAVNFDTHTCANMFGHVRLFLVGGWV